jgi:hypothetical protein
MTNSLMAVCEFPGTLEFHVSTEMTTITVKKAAELMSTKDLDTADSKCVRRIRTLQSGIAFMVLSIGCVSDVSLCICAYGRVQCAPDRTTVYHDLIHVLAVVQSANPRIASDASEYRRNETRAASSQLASARRRRRSKKPPKEQSFYPAPSAASYFSTICYPSSNSCSTSV